jgi:replication-associated recombination protein RarA
VYLSLAPKSRNVTDAINAAMEDVRSGHTGQAPATTQNPPSYRPIGVDDFRYYRG